MKLDYEFEVGRNAAGPSLKIYIWDLFASIFMVGVTLGISLEGQTVLLCPQPRSQVLTTGSSDEILLVRCSDHNWVFREAMAVLQGSSGL